MKIVSILQAINYLRLSSRVDAVASRVQTAVSMQRVTKVSFFLGRKLVPRIPRDSDHLERCSIAYSNQWKKRRIYKENLSYGSYR